MFLLKWYKEYLDIKAERDERKQNLNFCSACETLKLQLALANDERRVLIDKLTSSPQAEEKVTETSNLKPMLPSRMPWNVRRQILEREDRAAAKIQKQNAEVLTNAAKESTSKDLGVAEIEKELGVG